MGWSRKRISQWLDAKWSDDNDILRYSTHNKDKSIVAETFIRILKAKIYKKMTTNDNKSHLDLITQISC